MSEQNAAVKSGYPYVDRRGMAESVFPVENSLASSAMPATAHWSVGWADLMMTMFVLFLVLYVHQGEKRQFLGPERGEIIAGDTSLAESQATAAFPKITDGAPLVTAGQVREIERDDGQAKTIAPAPPPPAAVADKAAPDSPPEVLWYRLIHDLVFRERLYNRAAIDRLETGAIRLRLAADWLFQPGQAALTPDKPDLLRRLLDGLRAFPAPVTVFVHTDSRPLIAGPFADNWELSAARAGAFARFLSEEQGVAAGRITAGGRADSQPLSRDKDAGSQAANRRLEVIVGP
ncbi:MAG: OmpA family protein [Desulfobulbaceae bacterium]|jgi:chemotaxis protein MotB|nr:OmpA family protein [Desulfobulbaceae bacterium]